MPAPRLLDKRVVNTEVATQKRQQIQHGIALAKKVDAVRDTLQEEERNLETFRVETIKRVQAEIDVKIKEKDHLESEIARRKEERIKLEAPIDLQEAWREVLEGKVEVSDWRERLTNQSVQQLAREGEIKQSNEELTKRIDEVDRKEGLAERTLKSAEEKFEEASSVFDKAQANSKRLLDIAVKKEKQVVEREIEADERDALIVEREREVNEHETDLSNREKALKVRYDTFVRAQAYIKSKKHYLW
jgi:hypothetical protein